MRVPVIAGVTPGAGTSTLAAALHAIDGGALPGGRLEGRADVVVCRSAPGSMRSAESLVCPIAGPRPVLAVTLDADTTAAIAARLGPRFAEVVLVPHVDSWPGLASPGAEAATVLAQSAKHLPASLGPYAEALRRIVAAIVATGQLHDGAPPSVSGPRSVELWRGLRPVERTAPLPAVLVSAARWSVPGRLAAMPKSITEPPPVDPPPPPPAAELDDEAIEADQGAATRAGRTG